MQQPQFNDFLLPDWVKNNSASAMEQMLSNTSDSRLISFALGLPALELFPLAHFQNAIQEATASGAAIFQYKPPLEELKSHIVKIMLMRGVSCNENQILLTAGAQQGISLITRLLLDKNSTIITEELAYPGMLQAIKTFSPEILTVKTDLKTGIDVAAVETLLKKGKRPAFLYLVTDGGNPHAASLSYEKRIHLAELCYHYGMSIIEDDPYGFINYQDSLPPLKKYGGDWVFYLGSFSKIFAPSLRVGWIVAPECMIPALSSLKECSDINTTTFTQHIINKLLKKDIFIQHVTLLNQHYSKKKHLLIKALTRHFSSEIYFNVPSSGIFMWINFPEKINTSILLQEAKKQQVVFIPSEFFAATKKVTSYNGMRLNFSHPDEYEIDEGIRRLALSFQNIN